ncbi:hypothetical protein CLHUN_30500 [Ruminiclostridium hungatei]|uniref:Ribosomal processing cysteine protease Prp n=1 Tax=Ruminiclostridium hungatei TaxID=48256 RepID=A0A1V4SGV5_RUMHU|nr:ribosomal-processing cysteine protease Prp [Ruminiclostridium hungatei]OPX43108.1 hypothetical protein CLHUN_30500 [Ruminiclostridium hungatei]
MVNVNICRDKTGIIKKFVVKGHAGYAREGRDIVCAAVSAVAYTAAGALEDLIGIKDFFEERHGFLTCSIDVHMSPELKHDAGIIMAAAGIGFKQIELAYPKHVKVMDEEV